LKRWFAGIGREIDLIINKFIVAEVLLEVHTGSL